jgi:hypothetical protein
MNTIQKIALFCIMTAFIMSGVLLATKPWPKPEDLPLPPAPEIVGKPLPSFEQVATKAVIVDPLSEIEKIGMTAGKLKEDIEELSLINTILEQSPCSASEREELSGVITRIAAKLTDPLLPTAFPEKIQPIAQTIAKFYVQRRLKSGTLDPAAVPQVFSDLLDRPPESYLKDYEELLKACQ